MDDWITGTGGQLKVVFLPQVIFQFPHTKGPVVVHLTFLFRGGFLIALDKRDHDHNMTAKDLTDLPQDLFSFVFVIQENDAFCKRQLHDDEIGDLDAFIKETEIMIVVATQKSGLLLEL